MEERQETDSMGSDSNHANPGLSIKKLPKLKPGRAIAVLKHILRFVRESESKGWAYNQILLTYQLPTLAVHWPCRSVPENHRGEFMKNLLGSSSVDFEKFSRYNFQNCL